MRKRISPSSAKSSSSLRRAKLTRAAFATERSDAIAASSRTKPWSRTGIVFSGITGAVAVTQSRLEPRPDGSDGSAHVGSSGFSYPSWRPGFYPADARPEDFLTLYASRLPSVELNVTGYRLPSEESFERWRESAPPGFTFAVKMPARALRSLGTFEERAGLLGDR